MRKIIAALSLGLILSAQVSAELDPFSLNEPEQMLHSVGDVSPEAELQTLRSCVSSCLLDSKPQEVSRTAQDLLISLGSRWGEVRTYSFQRVVTLFWVWGFPLWRRRCG